MSWIADFTVHKHNILMKDFPLDELLAATDLEKVQEAVVLIFTHINKKLKISWVTPSSLPKNMPLIAQTLSYPTNTTTSRSHLARLQ